MSEYPAPRHPSYLLQERTTDPEVLYPFAQHIVEKRYGYPSLGRVQPGDDILVATYPHQNPLVFDVIRRAFLAEGAAKVDLVYLTDLGLEEHAYSAADGWREIPDALEPMVELGVDYNAAAFALKRYLDDRPGHTAIYIGEAAAIHYQRTASKRVRNTWIFTTYESLISRGNAYPDLLWDVIDRKVVDTFARAAEVRITDPQGTDISWKVTPSQADEWKRGSLVPGHILGSTLQTFRWANTPDVFLKEAPDFLRHLNGVVAGTGNHTGYFPHVEVHVENGMISKVVGGGKYGDLWREVIERFRDVHYPGFPYKGWAYFNDASIGTNPLSHRNIEGLWHYNDPHTNLPERLRAGVVHFGFGAEHFDKTFLDYARANRLPTMHFPHVHNYFPTWEMLDRASGEWFHLIDKGWLTVLDDPDVRRLADTFGVRLDYDWIPAIPGINHPGDYQADYGDDPSSWIEREQRGEFATGGVLG